MYGPHTTRDILLRDEVRDQMRLRSVDDDRAQAELLRDAQRGENVVRAVRMKMRLDAAVQHREQRLHLAVVIRLLMVVVYLGARLAREIFAAPCTARPG